MNRIPKKDDPRIITPVDAMVSTARSFAPGVEDWWITVYGTVNTLLPIEKRGLINQEKCFNESTQCTSNIQDNKERCTNKAVYISVGLFMTQKEPVNIMECRIRAFCAYCLYRDMINALHNIIHPNSFQKSEQNSEEVDPDSFFVVMEKVKFFEYYIPQIAKFLELNDPLALKTLNNECID
jgi:hypothetical protein